MKKLITDSKKCTGCQACMVACSGGHYQSYSTVNSRIKIIKLEDIGTDTPVVCKQCKKAPCINECPVGALSKNEMTNATLLNSEKCIGCGICAEACPFGAIILDSDEFPLICDLCDGAPKCAEVCPVGAVDYKDTNAVVEKKRINLAEKESKRFINKQAVK